MEWLLDKNGIWTIEIWLFEVVVALRTMVVAKAWRGLGGLPKKSVSWNFLIATAPRGHLIL